MSIKTLVITGLGLNCQKETDAAFTAAGSEVTQIHLNDLIENKSKLNDFHILAFIGGFSFGDHLGAGTVFSNKVKAALNEQLEKFINDGKLIIGICNGFQTITRLGIVPAISGLFNQEVALQHNDSGVFRDSWVNLKAEADSSCIFTKGIDTIELPIRHGEGKFIPLNESVLKVLEEGGYVCLRYADSDGNSTSEFPLNPNGSVNNIAGICDKSGRIFGLMPHPEAYLSPFNHPHWGKQKIEGKLPAKGLGQQIFDNAVKFAQENL